MHIGIISLFPEMFAALHYGVTGRALETKLLTISHWHPREYTQDKHKRVDDRPYGGGPGMVMKVQPLRDAIQAAKAAQRQASVIYLSPQGQLLQQSTVQALSRRPGLILVNGRYEGVDERLLLTDIDEQYSIGDYVLSGGELASLVLIDAIARLLPGALGHPASAGQDSFSHDLLDYPSYTRPETIAGQTIPEILKTGDHTAIARWRLKQSLGKTWQLRPDMLKKATLSAEEQILLSEFINEQSESLLGRRDVS